MVILALTAAIAFTFQQNEEPPSPDNYRVVAWMNQHVGQNSMGVPPIEIKDKGLAELTKATFHSVHYREFPVQMMPPKPMATRSLFSVKPDGAVTLFTFRKDLEKSFLTYAKPLESSSIKRLGIGYLKLSTVFSQDGMFQFVFDLKNLSIRSSRNEIVLQATAPVVEKSGDTGQLTATMTFKADQSTGSYLLVSISEKDTIKPGIRPICQCTLLLDQNPIVRKMAERDLLIMGLSAEPYIRKQLAQANPELRREIERVWQRIKRGER